MLLITGRYKGAPAMRHLRLGLNPEHFERGLELFSETAYEIFSPESAAHIIEKARRIGRNFRMRQPI